MAQQLRLYLVTLMLLIPQCGASHFRGAIITYEKVDSNDGQIHTSIDYRIAWRRSYSGHFCDSSTIRNGVSNGGGPLECLSNCQGSLGSLDYRCTDFSISEDWTSGRGHIDAVLPQSLSPLYDFGFSGCCWIDSLEVGNGGDWELRVRANMSVRSDTGRVNSPPGSDIVPIVRLQSGCNNTINIPVYDADGDTVRCRWAIGNECGSVCGAFTNAVLNEETCTITYRSRNQSENGTWYAVALQIEDFVGYYSSRSQPLSSIPLQFLVNVFHDNSGCHIGSRPVFGEPTLPDQSCITVQDGSRFTTNITVISRDNTNISTIQTISPIGLIKGALHQSYWNRSIWSMSVSWQPRSNITTNNIFCYTAVTTLGVTSEKRCINLLSESAAPHFLNHTRSPAYDTDSLHTLFSIELDKPFTWPAEPAYINLYRGYDNTLIESINATDINAIYHNGNTLEFNISKELQPGSYYFRFDEGVVRGTTYCRPSSQRFLWYFDVHTPIRLINGSHPSNGRLEIYNNHTWTPVCSNDFNTHEAILACRMLGYKYADNKTVAVYNNSISGERLKQHYNCRAYENDLDQCYHYYSYSYCNDVTIDCAFSVRLTDGNTTSSGRVEILDKHSGNWTTLCGTDFDAYAANAICKTLGYSKGQVNNNAYFGSSSYQRYRRLFCRGHEVDASQCYLNSSQWCWEDAGVDCGTQIRLVNGRGPYSGRVEVYYQGTWGTVCDDSFDVLDAKVICKMLGYYIGDSYLRAYQGVLFGRGTGSITIDDLQCDGNETDISQCDSLPWFTNNCGHDEDASVDCQYGIYSSTQYYTTAPSMTLRLVNGHDRYSGRVEVWHGGQWGTVCDDSFDHNDVKVICRMLGMNFGDSYGVAYTSAYYGQGRGPILIDELRCYGHESVIQSCNFNNWGTHDCSHSEDAGVDCRGQTGSSGSNTTRQTINYTNSYTNGYPYWLRPTTGMRYRLEDAISVSCNEDGWDVHVDMRILRQIYPNALTSDIYLGDNTCTGIYRGYDVIFQQGLRDCLTSEIAMYNSLVYRNQLVYAEHDRVHPFIIRHFNWTVDIECDVNRNETSSGHLHHDANSLNGHHVSGSSHYSVNMSFFSDPNFLYQLQGNPLHVQVGQDVYVKVFSMVADWTIKMKVHTCYTKPRPNAGDHLNLYLIQDGCEVDTNTHFISQSTHESRFVFQDFQYSSNLEGIYVYCKATFCETSDYSRKCTQMCNPSFRSGVIVRGNNTEFDDAVDTTGEP